MSRADGAQAARSKGLTLRGSAPQILLQHLIDFLPALFCLGGEGDEGMLLGQVKPCPDGFQMLLQLAAVNLVCLGSDDDWLEAVLDNPPVHRDVIGRRVVADVDQEKNTFQLF